MIKAWPTTRTNIGSSVTAMIVVQLTDTHIVERGQLQYGHVDTVAHLEAAVRHINGLDPQPDAVVLTGDLVNDGRPGQYLVLAEILAPLAAPLYPIPGNHDVLELLFETFSANPAVPPLGSATADYIVDDHEVRLIALDTTTPGEHSGRLADNQLEWLDSTLADRPSTPTLILMHHPPFLTGIDWMDNFGLQDPAPLERVVQSHDQIGAVLCGHLHRPINASFGGTMAMTCSSTAAEVALALGDRHQRSMIDEGPAVAIHYWPTGGRLVSHRSPIEPAVEPWSCWV